MTLLSSLAAALGWVADALLPVARGVQFGVGIAIGLAFVRGWQRRWRRAGAAADETSQTPEHYEPWKPPSFEPDEPALVDSAPASYQRTIGVEGLRAAIESLAARTYDLTPGDVRIELQDILALVPPAKGNVSTDEELSGWDRAELEQRFRNLQASHDYPRVQDVARIHELELLHQQACEQWQSDLDAKDRAQRATVDELLKEVGALRLDRDSWRRVAEDFGKQLDASNRRDAEAKAQTERWKEAYNEACLARDAAVEAKDVHSVLTAIVDECLGYIPTEPADKLEARIREALKAGKVAAVEVLSEGAGLLSDLAQARARIELEETWRACSAEKGSQGERIAELHLQRNDACQALIAKNAELERVRPLVEAAELYQERKGSDGAMASLHAAALNLPPREGA